MDADAIGDSNLSRSARTSRAVVVLEEEYGCDSRARFRFRFGTLRTRRRWDRRESLARREGEIWAISRGFD